MRANWDPETTIIDGSITRGSIPGCCSVTGEAVACGSPVDAKSWGVIKAMYR